MYSHSIIRPALAATLVLALAACGQQATPSPTTSAPSSNALSITPASADLTAGATLALTASTANVTWQANGGRISGSGARVTYTAPSEAGTYTVRATDPTGKRVASAQVKVAGPAKQPAPIPTLALDKRLENVPQVFDVQLDAAGNVYLAGEAREEQQNFLCTERTPPECSNDAFVAKYTPDGDLVWRKTFGRPAGVDENFSESAIDLVVNAGGRSTVLLSGVEGANVVRLSRDGNTLWTKRLEISALEQDRQGRVYAWRSVPFDAGFARLARLADDGSLQDVGTYPTSGFGTRIKLGNDDAVYSASVDANRRDVLLKRFALSGTPTWERRYRDERENARPSVHDLALDGRGGVFVAWSSKIPSEDVAETRASFRAYLKKYSTGGAWQFNERVPAFVPDPEVTVFGYSAQLVVSDRGEAYVNASSFTCFFGERCSLDQLGSISWKLSRFDVSGARSWTVDGDANVNALALDQRDRVFLSVDAQGTFSHSFLRRYDP